MRVEAVRAPDAQQADRRCRRRRRSGPGEQVRAHVARRRLRRAGTARRARARSAPARRRGRSARCSGRRRRSAVGRKQTRGRSLPVSAEDVVVEQRVAGAPSRSRRRRRRRSDVALLAPQEGRNPQAGSTNLRYLAYRPGPGVGSDTVSFGHLDRELVARAQVGASLPSSSSLAVWPRAKRQPLPCSWKVSLPFWLSVRR